jgi:uncharacterized membrane protein YfcA
LEECQAARHAPAVDLFWLALPLGLLAGALTTVAGVGGGVLLTLALSVAADPHTALAVVAPALLLGNLHRLWMLRASVERPTALAVGAPALVGAIVGGAVTAALPPTAIRVLMLAIAGLAVLRELGWLGGTVPRAWLVPAGVLVGFVTATSGGGGLLLAPLLLATGLKGVAFVGTGAAVAASIHVGRIGAYGAAGLIGAELVPTLVGLSIAILAGNLLGTVVRRRISERTADRITWTTLATGIALALFGVTQGG